MKYRGIYNTRWLLFNIAKRSKHLLIERVNHLHVIWTLPTDDCDYAKRWMLIKSEGYEFKTGQNW